MYSGMEYIGSNIDTYVAFLTLHFILFLIVINIYVGKLNMCSRHQSVVYSLMEAEIVVMRAQELPWLLLTSSFLPC